MPGLLGCLRSCYGRSGRGTRKSEEAKLRQHFQIVGDFPVLDNLSIYYVNNIDLRQGNFFACNREIPIRPVWVPVHVPRKTTLSPSAIKSSEVYLKSLRSHLKISERGLGN